MGRAPSSICVFKGNYRLAPDFRYPSALEDVLGVYQALLDMKIPAKRVVFVGHSAGATLALSAVIQLASLGKPMLAEVVALSAITDFTYSGASMTANEGKDIISRFETLEVRQASLGSAPPKDSPPLPLFGKLSSRPALLKGKTSQR